MGAAIRETGSDPCTLKLTVALILGFRFLHDPETK
jgi:hypothetical protein